MFFVISFLFTTLSVPPIPPNGGLINCSELAPLQSLSRPEVGRACPALAGGWGAENQWGANQSFLTRSFNPGNIISRHEWICE